MAETSGSKLVRADALLHLAIAQAHSQHAATLEKIRVEMEAEEPEPEPPPPPEPPLPEDAPVIQFNAQDDGNGTWKLSWQVAADAAWLDGDPVQLADYRYVFPVVPTTYTLRAVKNAVEATKTQEITPSGPFDSPVIFTTDRIEVPEGESATLSWKVTGAVSAVLQPAGGVETPVSLVGSLPVQPTGSVSYFLTAVLEDGRRLTKSASLLVRYLVPAQPLGTEVIPTSFGVIPDFAADSIVTHRTIANGNWSDPTIWDDGNIPERLAIVAIHHDVVYDVHSDEPLHCVGVRPGGRLRFDPATKTRLTVVTVLVSPGGTLEMGTELFPIDVAVTASIAFVAAPFATRDTSQFGGGLLCLGEFTAFGAAFTPTWVPIADAPTGSISLATGQPLSGWDAGEKVLLPAATRQTLPAWEVVVTQSIEGQTVNLVDLTAKPHTGYLARLIRNVGLRAANHRQEPRPHVLFGDNATVHIEGIIFHSLGRTDTTQTNYTGQAVGRTPCQFVGVANPFTVRGCCSMDVVPEHPQSTRRWGLTVEACSGVGTFEDNVIFNWAGAGIAFLRLSDSHHVVRGNLITFIHGIPSPFTGFSSDIGMGGYGVFALAQGNTIEGNVITDVGEAVHEEYPTPTPPPLQVITAETMTAPQYQVMLFSAIAGGGFPVYRYLWDWGDGVTSLGNTTSHAFRTMGTHEVTLTVSDAMGTTATATVMVTVLEGPPLPPAPLDPGLEGFINRLGVGAIYAKQSGPASDPDTFGTRDGNADKLDIESGRVVEWDVEQSE